MHRIILDLRKGIILVPKDVTNAVGAENDFGIWLSTMGDAILINDKTYHASQQKTRRQGRPAKHSGNMDKWDDEEKAYSISLSILTGYHDVIPGYRPDSKGRYLINGDPISKEGILFLFRNAVEAETIDLSGYEIITPQILRSRGRKW